MCELWKKALSGGVGSATEMKKLQDELTALRQQLGKHQAALKDKDAEVDSLKKKVITCIHTCTCMLCKISHPNKPLIEA